MDKDIFEGIKEGLEDAVAFTKGDEAKARAVHVMGDVDVKAIRKKTGMTQVEFSKAYFIPLPTLKNWERGARKPEGPSRAYLVAISHNPEEIKTALSEELIAAE